MRDCNFHRGTMRTPRDIKRKVNKLLGGVGRESLLSAESIFRKIEKRKKPVLGTAFLFANRPNRVLFRRKSQIYISAEEVEFSKANGKTGLRRFSGMENLNLRRKENGEKETYLSVRVITLQFLKEVRENIRVLFVKDAVGLLEHFVKALLAVCQ